MVRNFVELLPDAVPCTRRRDLMVMGDISGSCCTSALVLVPLDRIDVARQSERYLKRYLRYRWVTQSRHFVAMGREAVPNVRLRLE
jgi:hypothetical protein